MPPAASDETLVARFRAGDRDAFAVLYARHRPVVVRAARGMLAGSGVDAEAVAQDAFLSAFHVLPRTSGSMLVRPYLLRIARNRALDALRRPQALPFDETLDGAVDTTGVVERREELARALEALRALPDRQRAALVGLAFEGRSLQELARGLDTTVAGAKSLLMRARTTLRQAAPAAA